MLFGQVMNFWAIALFDQSVVFFYVVLATVGAAEVVTLGVAAEGADDQTTRVRLARTAGDLRTGKQRRDSKPLVLSGWSSGVR